MKDLLNRVKGEFTQYAYKKRGSSFWKYEDGFYKLVNFQGGAYGDYFFVNIGLHPVGLPSLFTGRLEIHEKPPESKCIIRQRIEEIVSIGASATRMIPVHDVDAAQIIVESIPAIEAWLSSWGSYDTICSADFKELSKIMTSVVPIIQRKAYWMLKYYCLIKQESYSEAKQAFLNYLSENVDMDFIEVDNYLKALQEGGSTPAK